MPKPPRPWDLWEYYKDCPEECGLWWEITKRLSFSCLTCRITRYYDENNQPAPEGLEEADYLEPIILASEVQQAMDQASKEILIALEGEAYAS